MIICVTIDHIISAAYIISYDVMARMPCPRPPRAERLEIFDEFEEWNMIQQHYCIAIGVNERRGDGAGSSGGGLLDGFGFPEFPSPELPFAAPRPRTHALA